MSQPVILALDLGTSSFRGLLFNLKGKPAADRMVRRAYQFALLPEGGAQANPDHLLELLFECIDECLSQTEQLGLQVQAVGMCTFVSNLLGVDAGGRAVTPLIPYFDNRATQRAAVLRARLDENAIHQRTGCRLHPSYLPAQLLWLAEEMQEAFRQVRSWMSLGEYVWLRCFGEPAASYSAASWSGLLNRYTLAWDQDLLAELPVDPVQFSALRDHDQPASDLLGEYRRRWPGLAGVPWFPAVGDGAAANLGSGCQSEDSIAISIGTSSAVRVVLARQTGHPAGAMVRRSTGSGRCWAVRFPKGQSAGVAATDAAASGGQNWPSGAPPRQAGNDLLTIARRRTQSRMGSRCSGSSFWSDPGDPANRNLPDRDGRANLPPRFGL
jgi:gluconokinase